MSGEVGVDDVDEVVVCVEMVSDAPADDVSYFKAIGATVQDIRVANGSVSPRGVGGSYLQDGFDLERKPNNAPRSNEDEKLS
jgi:hypothetical protein